MGNELIFDYYGDPSPPSKENTVECDWNLAIWVSDAVPQVADKKRKKEYFPTLLSFIITKVPYLEMIQNKLPSKNKKMALDP